MHAETRRCNNLDADYYVAAARHVGLPEPSVRSIGPNENEVTCRYWHELNRAYQKFTASPTV